MNAPEMVPLMNNGGRWDHIASERELAYAIRAKDVRVIEVPMLRMTYLVSPSFLTIIRCGGTMGGDTRDIEGGWVYPHDIAMRLDEFEIMGLAAHPANEAFG